MFNGFSKAQLRFLSQSAIPLAADYTAHYRTNCCSYAFQRKICGGWAILTGKYNAGLSLNIDRNNWGGVPLLPLLVVVRRLPGLKGLSLCNPQAVSVKHRNLKGASDFF